MFGEIHVIAGRTQCAPTAHMFLSPFGEVVEAEITRLSETYFGIYVDCHVVMPNHVHMVIAVGRRDKSRVGAHSVRPSPTLPMIIKLWKEAITKKVGRSFWQKSFYDHIIRDEADYLRIVEYIQNNPAQWTNDKYYVGAHSVRPLQKE